jgi:hypothetical protein
VTFWSAGRDCARAVDELSGGPATSRVATRDMSVMFQIGSAGRCVTEAVLPIPIAARAWVAR